MERPIGAMAIGVALFAGSSYGIMCMSKAPTGGDSWGFAPYLAGALVIMMAVVFGIGVLFFALGLGLLNRRKCARACGWPWQQ